MKLPQTAIGAGTLLAGIGFIVGATAISSDAGYAGVGPNFLPWVVGLALLICGGFLVYEAQSGGYRDGPINGQAVREWVPWNIILCALRPLHT